MQQNDKNPPKNQLSDQIDSLHDREELLEKATSIDIPDAHSIPGQEDFAPAPIGEVADTAIASSDEEDDSLFDENLREAALDNSDDDGEVLNEESFQDNISASDLDIPGDELDDAEENIGEEDEENNDYSLVGDNDEIPQDQF